MADVRGVAPEAGCCDYLLDILVGCGAALGLTVLLNGSAVHCWIEALYIAGLLRPAGSLLCRSIHPHYSYCLLHHALPPPKPLSSMVVTWRSGVVPILSQPGSAIRFHREQK